MYGNAMEKFVNVIAGKPGAGKTLYVQKEIEDVIRDPERVAILIANTPPKKFMLDSDTKDGNNMYRKLLPANLLFFDFSHAASGIGKAIDIANVIGDGMPVNLYYDQNRYSMPSYIRDMLVVASKAGVNVTVTVQKFGQIDKNDKEWLNENCYLYIISKQRPPREALSDEINKTYR